MTASFRFHIFPIIILIAALSRVCFTRDVFVESASTQTSNPDGSEAFPFKAIEQALIFIDSVPLENHVIIVKEKSNSAPPHVVTIKWEQKSNIVEIKSFDNLVAINVFLEANSGILIKNKSLLIKNLCLTTNNKIKMTFPIQCLEGCNWDIRNSNIQITSNGLLFSNNSALIGFYDVIITLQVSQLADPVLSLENSKSITLNNITLKQNSMDSSKSIIYAKNTASLLIYDCKFIDNTIKSSKLMEFINTASVTILNIEATSNKIGLGSSILAFFNENTIPPAEINLEKLKAISNSAFYTEINKYLLSPDLNTIIKTSNALLYTKNSQFTSNQLLKSLIYTEEVRTEGVFIMTTTFFNNSAEVLIHISNVYKIELTDLIVDSSNRYLPPIFSEINLVYGNTLRAVENKLAKIKNLTISSSFAINTAPGIAHISDDEGSIVDISELDCCLNKAFIFNDQPNYYGVCLFLSSRTSVSVSDSKFVNNVNENAKGTGLGGNVCINSQTTKNPNLNVLNCVFKGNRATVESICIKFSGKNFYMTNSLLEDNKFSGKDFSISNDAGALHLGSDNAVVEYTNFLNNSAFSGAAIKLQNYLGKPSQVVLLDNIVMSKNIGESTAAIEFHTSILSIQFLMKNSIISNNSVSFHAVVSIFYNGVGTDVMKFQNITVERNIGKSIGGSFFFPVLLGTVMFEKSVFRSNYLMGNPFIGGAIFLIWGGNKLNIRSYNCEFYDNYCNARAGVVLAQYGQYHEYNSIFKNNFAPFSSTISIEVTAVCSLSNSTITGKPSYHTGAFYISNSAKITIDNTKFYDCQAEVGGGVMTAYGSRVVLVITNCKFYNNKANVDAAILEASLSLARTIVMDNCELIGNSGGRSLLVISDLNIKMTNTKIINNFASILEARGSSINFTDVSNDNSSSSNMKRSLFTVTSGSNMNFKNIVLSNNKTKSPPLFYFEDAVFVLESSILINFNQQSEGTTLLFSDHSELNISKSKFFNVKMVLLKILGGELTMNQCLISDIVSTKLSTGLIQEITNIKINNCEFSNILSNDFGGALSIMNEKILPNQVILINNSNFQNCSAKSGGAIYLHNSDLVLKNVTFLKNEAAEFGGALHVSCQLEFKCSWNFSSCVLKNNKANIGGGAIKYTGAVADKIENMLFTDNTAAYGKDYLSFPVKLMLLKANSNNNSNIQYEDPVDCDIKSEDCIFSNQISGYLMESFSLEFRDTFNQLYHDSTLKGQAEVILEANHTGVPNYIEGETSIQSDSGRLGFKSLFPFVKPGTKVRLGVSLTIPYDKRFTLLNNFYQVINTTGKLQFVLPAQFRSCIQGEIEIKTMNLCYKCLEGSYSLDVRDSQCYRCLDNVKCRGGSYLEVNPGFWRKNTNTTNIYSCNSQMDSCIGGYDNICLNGYQGILCSDCRGTENGDSQNELFFKKTMFSCESCEMWPLYFAILAILFLVFESLIIYINYKQSTTAKKSKEPVSKILSTHMQFIFQTTSQGIEMPKPVQTVSTSITVSMSSEGLFNFLSCLQTYIPLSKFLLNLLITLFSIFLFTIFPWLVWKIIGKLKGMNPKVVKGKSINTLVVIIYFLQSSYVNFFITNLRCKEYEGQQYMTNNLGQKCWDSHHTLFSIIITFPMLLIWMVILPGTILYYLLKSKKSKENAESLFSQVLNYFVAGYRSEKIYWEFVILIEKYIFIIIPLIIEKNTLPVLILYASLLLCYLVLHTEVRPYMTKELNRLQTISFYACFISYISSITSLISNSDNLRIFISVLFFLCNGIFLIDWLWCYYQLILKGQLKILSVKLQSRVSSYKVKKSNTKKNTFESNKTKTFENDEGK